MRLPGEWSKEPLSRENDHVPDRQDRQDVRNGRLLIPLDTSGQRRQSSGRGCPRPFLDHKWFLNHGVAQRKFDPEQAVALLGCDLLGNDLCREANLPSKRSVVNLEGEDLLRTRRCRFGRSPCSFREAAF